MRKLGNNHKKSVQNQKLMDSTNFCVQSLKIKNKIVGKRFKISRMKPTPVGG